MEHVNRQQQLINKCRAIKSSIDRLIVLLKLIDRAAINSAIFQIHVHSFLFAINIHFIPALKFFHAP